MPVFIDSATIDFPAFIYYPGDVAAVSDSPDSSSYTPADVLEADELNGWAPASTTGDHALIFDFGTATPISCIALAGSGMDGIALEIRGSTDNFSSSDVAVSAEAALSGDAYAWRSFTQAEYRYYKLIFSGHGTDFIVYHAVLQLLQPLPYLEDGACLSPLTTDGTALISQQGLRLGSVINKVSRRFNLDWGQVTAAELAYFTAWAERCLPLLQPFFFIPDINQPVAHFGSVDDKTDWQPKMKHGLYDPSKLVFTARGV